MQEGNVRACQHRVSTRSRVGSARRDPAFAASVQDIGRGRADPPSPTSPARRRLMADDRAMEVDDLPPLDARHAVAAARPGANSDAVRQAMRNMLTAAARAAAARPLLAPPVPSAAATPRAKAAAARPLLAHAVPAAATTPQAKSSAARPLLAPPCPAAGATLPRGDGGGSDGGGDGGGGAGGAPPAALPRHSQIGGSVRVFPYDLDMRFYKVATVALPLDGDHFRGDTLSGASSGVFPEQPGLLQVLKGPLGMWVAPRAGESLQATKLALCAVLHAMGVEVPMPTHSSRRTLSLGACNVRLSYVRWALLRLGITAVYVGRFGEKFYLEDGITMEAFFPFYSLPSDNTAADLGLMLRDPQYHFMWSLASPTVYGTKRFPAGTLAPAEEGEITMRVIPLVPSAQCNDWPWVAGSLEVRKGTGGKSNAEVNFGNPRGKWIELYSNEHHRTCACGNNRFWYPKTMSALRVLGDRLFAQIEVSLDPAQPASNGGRMECRCRACDYGRDMTLFDTAQIACADLDWVIGLVRGGVLRVKRVSVNEWRDILRNGLARCRALDVFGGLHNSEPQNTSPSEVHHKFHAKRDEALWLAADVFIGSGRFCRDIMRFMDDKFNPKPSGDLVVIEGDGFERGVGPGAVPFVAGSRDALRYDAAGRARGGEGCADGGAAGGVHERRWRDHVRMDVVHKRMRREPSPLLYRKDLSPDAQAVHDLLLPKKFGGGGRVGTYYLPAAGKPGVRPKTRSYATQAALALAIWNEFGPQWASFVENVNSHHPGASTAVGLTAAVAARTEAVEAAGAAAATGADAEAVAPPPASVVGAAVRRRVVGKQPYPRAPFPQEYRTYTNPLSATRPCGSATRADYNGYFEKQQRGLCGLHALNNLVGSDFFTESYLRDICGLYLRDKEDSGGLQEGEDASWHQNANGWFSSEVLAYALRHTGLLYGEGARSFDMKLRQVTLEDWDDDRALGAIQNRAGRHWVALRKLDGEIILLDSMNRPRFLTRHELTALIAAHPTTYIVHGHNP